MTTTPRRTHVSLWSRWLEQNRTYGQAIERWAHPMEAQRKPSTPPAPGPRA